MGGLGEEGGSAASKGDNTVEDEEGKDQGIDGNEAGGADGNEDGGIDGIDGSEGPLNKTGGGRPAMIPLNRSRFAFLCTEQSEVPLRMQSSRHILLAHAALRLRLLPLVHGLARQGAATPVGIDSAGVEVEEAGTGGADVGGS